MFELVLINLVFHISFIVYYQLSGGFTISCEHNQK